MRVRPGFAVVAALSAIVLIGFLVVAILFATGQESRATAAEILDAQAIGLAESAAISRAAEWDCPDCDLLPVGTVIIQNRPASQRFESATYTTRLDSTVFLITGEARSRDTGIMPVQRRISIVVSISHDSAGVAHAKPLRSHYWSAVYPL